jgi:hypothetical protein
MKPVGVSSFLEDDRVQGIINVNNGGVIVNPGYENPEDIPPVLALGDGSSLKHGDFVPVDGSVTITVTNANVYDTIKWFCDGVELGEGKDFVVDTDDPPFDEDGTYQLAVIGYVGTEKDVPYSTEIFIVIGE